MVCLSSCPSEGKGNINAQWSTSIQWRYCRPLALATRAGVLPSVPSFRSGSEHSMQGRILETGKASGSSVIIVVIRDTWIWTVTACPCLITKEGILTWSLHGPEPGPGRTGNFWIRPWFVRYKYSRVSFCDGSFYDDSLLRRLSSRTEHSRLLVHQCRNASVLSVLNAFLALFWCALVSSFSIFMQFF
jgi:hypothetical protein